MRSPTKKIAPVILACVIAVGGIIYAATYTKNSKSEASLQDGASLVAVQSNSVASNLREIDTDGDGLKDWEESLWKSDPRNEDSDGDGSLDGEEVEAGRNPLVIGPHDLITTQEESTFIKQNTNATTTRTGVIARELFANYINLKKSGADITPSMEDEIIQNTLLVADYGQSDATVYNTTDILIVNDTSTEALRKYATQMGEVFRKNNPQTDENELVIMSKVVITRNTGDIAKLDVIIDSYRKIIQDSIKVPVPTALASLHLDFINAFSMGLDADIQMRRLFEDAAASLIGLKQYEDAAIKISNTHEAIQNYYISQSVVFNQNEDGYGFLHMIAH